MSAVKTFPELQKLRDKIWTWDRSTPREVCTAVYDVLAAFGVTTRTNFNADEIEKEEALGRATFTVELTRDEALALGIVHCECGHPPNNHFEHGSRPCAHCDCAALNEHVSVGRTTYEAT